MASILALMLLNLWLPYASAETSQDLDPMVSPDPQATVTGESSANVVTADATREETKIEETKKEEKKLEEKEKKKSKKSSKKKSSDKKKKKSSSKSTKKHKKSSN